MVDPTPLCNRFQAMVAWVISETRVNRSTHQAGVPLLRYALERRTRQRVSTRIEPTKLFLQREKKKLGSQLGFEPRARARASIVR